jgi:hypothetical protein
VPNILPTAITSAGSWTPNVIAASSAVSWSEPMTTASMMS